MLRIDRLRTEYASEVAKLEGIVFGRDAWTEEDFIEAANLDYAYYITVWDNEILVGACGLRNMCGDGFITNVMVREGFRRQGVAEMMLSELMLRCRSMGVRNYTLEVRASNVPAIGLYEKLGFVKEGIRPDFYSYPDEDAIIMWRRIS